jgi:hypothetical protein
MSAQIGALVAAVRTMVRARLARRFGMFAGMALSAMTLSGCAAPMAPPIGADPAAPGAKVAGVGYRSGIAPYTSMRPTTPSGWREQNQRVTPPSAIEE